MAKKPSRGNLSLGKYVPVKPSRPLGKKRPKRVPKKGQKKHISPNKGLPYFEYVPTGPKIWKKTAKLLPKERTKRAIRLAEQVSKIIAVFQKGLLVRKNDRIIQAVKDSLKMAKTRQEVERGGKLLVQKVKNYWDAMISFAKIKKVSKEAISNLENMKNFYIEEAEGFVEREWKKRKQ